MEIPLQKFYPIKLSKKIIANAGAIFAPQHVMITEITSIPEIIAVIHRLH